MDENAGYWEFALDARLRASHGDAFQRLFEDLMTRVYGDDFVAVKVHGDVGDGGMDGYFCVDDTVFQCYGAEGGHVLRIDRVQKKMLHDFERARSTTPSMKEWKFVHNLVDGVPRPLIDTYQKIKDTASEHGIAVKFFGIATFRDHVARLDDAAKARLLGVKAFNDLATERLPEEIRKIVAFLMVEIGPLRSRHLPANNVPQKKIVINNIDDHWKTQIEFFLRYSAVSRHVLQTQGGPNDGPKFATFFRDKYEALRDEGFDPPRILYDLKTMLTGRFIDLDGHLREFAVMTLLADLFESCVIFEESGEEGKLELADDLAN